MTSSHNHHRKEDNIDELISVMNGILILTALLTFQLQPFYPSGAFHNCLRYLFNPDLIDIRGLAQYLYNFILNPTQSIKIKPVKVFYQLNLLSGITLERLTLDDRTDTLRVMPQ